jgi:ATP-binding cassette subfamily F protein 3
MEKPDLLILDEPTNHLDIESREALIMALNQYSGSLILVSHDAFLVERLVDRLLVVKNGNVSEFEGDIHEYRKLILSGKTVGEDKKTNKNKITNSNFRESVSNLKKTLSSIEKKILDYEKQRQLLETEMLDTGFYEPSNNKRIEEVNVNLKTINNKILEEEKRWEQIFEKIEMSNR